MASVCVQSVSSCTYTLPWSPVRLQTQRLSKTTICPALFKPSLGQQGPSSFLRRRPPTTAASQGEQARAACACLAREGMLSSRTGARGTLGIWRAYPLHNRFDKVNVSVPMIVLRCPSSDFLV